MDSRLLKEDLDAWWIDRMYLQHAWVAASYSQDRSTQVGSILVVPDRGTIMSGWNCIHDKLILSGYEYSSEDKRHTTEHAERKVIFKTLANGLPVEGMTMYCTWACCSECARTIIEFGVSRVVTLRRLVESTPDRWEESVKNGIEMLVRSGIPVIGWNGNLGVDFPLRFNRTDIRNEDLI